MKDQKFIDIMVDLETLSTASNAVMLSIGAVAFSAQSNELGPEYHNIVSLTSGLSYGLQQSEDTIVWWNKQSPAARKTLLASEKSKVDLKKSMEDFNKWLSQFDLAKLRVWGNGSDFDNVILKSSYDATGVRMPWKFYNNRCYRTIKSLYKEVELAREGVYHNALDDAKTQAKHLLKIMEKCNGR
jgi:hypothetical protein